MRQENAPRKRRGREFVRSSLAIRIRYLRTHTQWKGEERAAVDTHSLRLTRCQCVCEERSQERRRRLPAHTLSVERRARCYTAEVFVCTALRALSVCIVCGGDGGGCARRTCVEIVCVCMWRIE